MRIILFLILPFFCFCQEDNYDKLNKLPKAEFEKAVSDSIVKLQSHNLWNFLQSLKVDYKRDLKRFNGNFLIKMETVKWPFEMYFLLNFLLEQKTDKLLVENILNRRNALWDNGQWSEKFWKVIGENNLKVEEGEFYSINEKGQKTYDINSFLEDKIKCKEIGKNPLLSLNYTISDYEPNKLLETLKKMHIKDIQIISKEEAPKVFGTSGADGMIIVLTR